MKNMGVLCAYLHTFQITQQLKLKKIRLERPLPRENIQITKAISKIQNIRIFIACLVMIYVRPDQCYEVPSLC